MAGGTMRLTKISGGECDITNCPTVYATDRDTFVVQGWTVSDREALSWLSVPDGETVVEIPRSLLEDAVGSDR